MNKAYELSVDKKSQDQDIKCESKKSEEPPYTLYKLFLIDINIFIFLLS